jgi:DNA-binding GntR family transcriptional regulator
LSLDEVKELYETLVILEKNIAYLAALRIDDHELENIRKIQKDHDRAIKKAQSNLNPKSQEKACWEFTDLNFEFHRLIAMVCKNRFLYKTHQNIRSQAERFSYITFLRQGSKNGETNEYYLDISKQHHEIIKCLENRDCERIGDVVVNHVKYFQNQIINSMLNIFYA